MQRSSDKHSPRVDDQMAKEVASLLDGAPVEARMDESRSFEGAADGEPTPESVIVHDNPYRDRTELARRLRPSIFPAHRAEIVQCALDEHAPADLIAALRTIPDVEYHTPNDIWIALGGETEHRFEEPEVSVAPEPGPAFHRFGFRFDWRYRIAALPFGITPGRAFVEIDRRRSEPTFRAHFGWWEVVTPLANIESVTRSGPYSLPKTIGPPHLSLADRGLTFASTGAEGLCISFVEPVRALDPFGVVHHPALTVTVDDVEALASALETSAA